MNQIVYGITTRGCCARVANDLAAVADQYESLQTEFKRLWLAEDRDNDGFQELVKQPKAYAFDKLEMTVCHPAGLEDHRT